MLGTRLKITNYARQHRSALLNLAGSSRWAHKHLDWHNTADWLDSELGCVWLAWKGAQLQGYIGLSPPIAGWSWIQLLGIRDGKMPGLLLRELCEAAECHCAERGIANIAVLMITNWLPSYLRQRGFCHEDDIITMSQIGKPGPAAPDIAARLRTAQIEDINDMILIDSLAFHAPWQLADYDIWRAFRSAASVTVATLDNQVLGYQISTRQAEIGHLARLAVHPAQQRKGIASALLQQLLSDFKRRNVTELSVNTQLGNRPSQRLYERFGFYRNGKDIEMWRKRISKRIN